MKLNIKVHTNIRMAAVMAQVDTATAEALRDTVVAITEDTKKPPPVGSPYLTGNNRRSIDFFARGMSGMVFSTSGYGGYLETGTARMPARPYFWPAYLRHKDEFPKGIRTRLALRV